MKSPKPRPAPKPAPVRVAGLDVARSAKGTPSLLTRLAGK